LLGAAAIAAAATSADAADDFKCASEEIFVGSYYNCNAATTEKRTECNAANKENLSTVAKAFGMSQIRMNGNDMGICATWNNDQMGPIQKPALKAFQ
jgi:hypothetical protein